MSLRISLFAVRVANVEAKGKDLARFFIARGKRPRVLVQRRRCALSRTNKSEKNGDI
jgi:hypothetical protein